MYNHKKWKNSAFLTDTLYPERMLSRHKHARKSGWYSRLKRQYLLAHSSFPSKKGIDLPGKDSRILFQPIHQMYAQRSPLYKKGQPWERETPAISSLLESPFIQQKDTRTLRRGLQEMQESSLTNGLLGSGFRYFRVDS